MDILSFWPICFIVVVNIEPADQQIELQKCGDQKLDLSWFSVDEFSARGLSSKARNIHSSILLKGEVLEMEFDGLGCCPRGSLFVWGVVLWFQCITEVEIFDSDTYSHLPAPCCRALHWEKTGNDRRSLEGSLILQRKTPDGDKDWGAPFSTRFDIKVRTLKPVRKWYANESGAYSLDRHWKITV